MNFLLMVFVFYALIFDRLNIFLSLIVSSLLHESGHIIADIICGYKPILKISLFGICLVNYPADNRRKFIVLICGPMVNVIIIIICRIFLKINFRLNLYIFMCVNLVILIFNTLPVSFLDGGQMLKIFITDKKILRTAEVISLIAMTVILFCTTDNTVVTVVGISLFLMYCYINKKDLRLK